MSPELISDTMGLGAICFLNEVGSVDATAIVSAVALGAVLVIWVVLVVMTTLRGGGSAWKRGYVYYVAYRYVLDLYIYKG